MQLPWYTSTDVLGRAAHRCEEDQQPKFELTNLHKQPVPHGCTQVIGDVVLNYIFLGGQYDWAADLSYSANIYRSGRKHTHIACYDKDIIFMPIQFGLTGLFRLLLLM